MENEDNNKTANASTEAEKKPAIASQQRNAEGEGDRKAMNPWVKRGLQCLVGATAAYGLVKFGERRGVKKTMDQFGLDVKAIGADK